MNRVSLTPPGPASSPVLLDRGTTVATVHLNGELIALTGRGVVLGETGYKPRVYIPLCDVRVTLRHAERTTHCPWKGDANYFDTDIRGTLFTNAAWTYRRPLAHLQAICEFVSFDDRFHISIG